MARFDIAVYTRLKYWVQLALPLVYDDSLSYMELLAKVVNSVNTLGESFNQLLEELEQEGYDYTQMLEDIALLKEEMEKVKNGEYVSAYIDALSQWIDANLQEIIAKSVFFVQFGITDDGYFYADIPDNWSMLRFETGYDESKPDEYLHLILNY